MRFFHVNNLFFPDYDLNTLSILKGEPLPWGDTQACLERFIIARLRRTSIHHIFFVLKTFKEVGGAGFVNHESS